MDIPLALAIFTAAVSVAGLAIAVVRHMKSDSKWQGKVQQALKDLGKSINGD
jgi:uncharacterized protein YoxC